MAKIDLHAHTKFSHHASEWFLQKIGANESYTEPEDLYRLAKQQGMDFVTITDHNRIEGALRLKEAHPEDVLTGLEATSYFPEDGCKVHVLVYGIGNDEHRAIEKYRNNIYELRDYLKAENLAHSLAHAAYAVNGRLTLEHLEKLVLLFDVFEGINGCRDRRANAGWTEALARLTPGHIDRLYAKHRIEPFGDTPWMKSFTGGSDDHAGLFIGRTYTRLDAGSPEGVLQALRGKKTQAAGRHNDYLTFAFTIYKIALDYSQAKTAGSPASLLERLNEVLFRQGGLSLADRLKLQLGRSRAEKKGRRIEAALLELVQNLQQNLDLPAEEKFRIAYTGVSDAADAFTTALIESLPLHFKTGNIFKMIRDVSSLVPLAFLYAPFCSSLHNLFGGRDLVRQFAQRLTPAGEISRKRVLWFTDTLEDLNGVSETVKKIGWLAHEKGWDVRIASAPIQEPGPETPPNLLRLPAIHHFRLPGYGHLQITIPSFMKSLEMIYRHDPDEIIISTPGPVGLLGLSAAKLLQVPCMGIYHTDFHSLALQLTSDESVANAMEAYTRWFYSAMDKIKVPTLGYINILESRGYDPDKLVHYRKAVDTRHFKPVPRPGGTTTAFTLVYAGRLSRDKNLEFIIDVFKAAFLRSEGLELCFVGDGPDALTLRHRGKNVPGIRWIGRQKRREMPAIYASADILVFPSVTDTFGMAVVEAQACGLPVLVSDVGGPHEIIVPGSTGYVLEANNLEMWVEKILELQRMKTEHREAWAQLKQRARAHVVENYDWDRGFCELLQPAPLGHRFMTQAPEKQPEPASVAVSEAARRAH